MALTKREISRGYDAMLERMGLSPRFYQAAISMAGELSGRVLDLGCGVGGLLEQIRNRFPGISLAGGDISFVLSRETKKKQITANVFQGDVEWLPLRDAVVDCVFMTEVLEHLLDYKKGLSEVYRVLRPGGRLVVTVPNRDWVRYDRFMSEHVPYQPVDDHWFTRGELEQLLVSAGFHVVKVNGWGSLSGRRGVFRLAEKLKTMWEPSLSLQRKRLMMLAEKRIH